VLSGRMVVGWTSRLVDTIARYVVTVIDRQAAGTYNLTNGEQVGPRRHKCRAVHDRVHPVGERQRRARTSCRILLVTGPVAAGARPRPVTSQPLRPQPWRPARR